MTNGVFTLYGLRIEAIDGPSDDERRGADIAWHRQTVTDLAPRPVPAIVARASDRGEWIDHYYGPPGTVACAFSVAPDGRQVVSQSLPGVAPADLFALFAEPVMRTILRRRGLVSFHAAALARDGEAMLIVGAKGAGKSTLSAMLMQLGWTLLTDDLACVRQSDSDWLVAPGHAQLKLRDDAAARLGFGSRLARRWQDAAAPDDPWANKYILSESGAVTAPAILRAIYVLGARNDGEDARVTAMPPSESLGTLLANMTGDPLRPGPPGDPASFVAAGAIASRVALRRLSMPGNFTRARAAAERFAAYALTPPA